LDSDKALMAKMSFMSPGTENEVTQWLDLILSPSFLAASCK